MNKLIKMMLMALVLLPLQAQSATVYNVLSRVFSTKDAANDPVVTITPNDTGYLVTFSFEEFELAEDDLYPGSYQLTIPGFGVNRNVSEASIPMRGYDVVFGLGQMPEVRVLSCDSVVCPIVVAPARPDLIESENVEYSRNNVLPITTLSANATNGPVYVREVNSYRGNGIVTLAISPIKYDHSSRKCTVYKNITCQVSAGGNGPNHALVTHPIQWNNYQTSIDIFPDNRWVYRPFVPQNDSHDLLIVTSETFESELDEFIAWKRKEGYNTSVLVCHPGETPASIRNAIIDFAKDHRSLFAILIVGDLNHIPSWPYSSSSYNRVSDLNYACIDHTDEDSYIPDVLIGRIPASDKVELSNALYKILYYETGKYFSITYMTRQLSNALHVACFEGKKMETRGFILTSERIRTAVSNKNYSIARVYSKSSDVEPKYFNNGTRLPDDLCSPNFSWDGSVSDIYNEWKRSLNYVLYRGHGEKGGWSNPSFKYTNFGYLSEGGNFPPVFSISCLTGDITEDKCFAGELLFAENKGSSGVLASILPSETYCNDEIAKGIANTMFPNMNLITDTQATYNQWLTVGESVKLGLNYMKSVYGKNAKDHYHTYLWFGDPTMRLYSWRANRISNLGFSFIGSNVIATAPGLDVQISAVYDDGNVISYRRDEATFPKAGLETITFTGKDIMPRTLTIDEMTVDNGTGNFGCSLNYVVSKECTIEAHYYVPTSLSIVGRPSTNTHDAYIVVTDQYGTVVRQEQCAQGYGIATIQIRNLGAPKVYTVSMIDNGALVGATKILVQL